MKILPGWVACLLLVGAGQARAGESAPPSALQAYQEGNRLYAAASFQSAAAAYDRARATRWSSGELEYNRANALLKIGRLGPAIAGYERARKLGLDDRDVTLSLKYARTMVRDAAPEEPVSRLVSATLALFRILPPRPMFWCGWGALAAGCVLLGLRWAGSRVRWLGLTPWLLGGAVLLQGGALLKQHWLDRDVRAVIVSPTLSLCSGPGPDFPTSATLHEGVVLQVVGEAGQWRQVEGPGGEIGGWVPASTLEDI